MNNSSEVAENITARRSTPSTDTDPYANPSLRSPHGTSDNAYCAQAAAEATVTPSRALGPLAQPAVVPAISPPAASTFTTTRSSVTWSDSIARAIYDLPSFDNVLESTVLNTAASVLSSVPMMHQRYIGPMTAEGNTPYQSHVTTSIEACNTVPVWTKPMPTPYVHVPYVNNFRPPSKSVCACTTTNTPPSLASNNQFCSFTPSAIYASPSAAHVTANNLTSCHTPNNHPEVTLTSSQIASRQVVAKELPTFSGKSEEWPLFITNFVQSTERCGFTDQENLLRLQKCLKGPALEAVRGKLMMPSTVSSAIDTLKMLFGRADVIHQSMQNKLRREPPIRTDKLENLIHFALAVQNYCSTVEAIGLGDYLNDPALLTDLVGKLPNDLKLDWCRHQMCFQRANVKTFDVWLFNLATCASHLTSFGQSPQNNREEKNFNKQPRQRILMHEVAEQKQNAPQQVLCAKCGDNHRLSQCHLFLSLSVNERWSLVRLKRICLRCLKNHPLRRCNLRTQCGVDGCKMPHNALLHNNQCPEENRVISFHSAPRKKVVFRYIPVRLYGQRKHIDTFALIDEGSACTLVESTIATELELDGPSEELCLKWTGDICQNETSSKIVNFSISSRQPSAQRFRLRSVRTISNLDLPVQSLEVADIQQRKHLRNLPIVPYRNARARILIGLDNLKIGLPSKTREANGDNLIAAKCRLGWTVYGRNDINDSATQRILHVCVSTTEEKLDDMLKTWFSLESLGVGPKQSTPQSKDNERALHIMESTTKYIPSEKRWESGLLWKDDIIDLPNSLPMARRRLQCLEKKMSRDPVLCKFLADTIKAYEERGYIRKLESNEIRHAPKSWYLPIFTVSNPNKKKIRLVWDAAAKVNDVALNTYLLKGPDFLTSLVGVLIRFREKPIAICGDIKEMFHQIRIRKEDQISQKFLWRGSNLSKEPDVYVMQVMTFGAACSPSIANFVRDKNANRWENLYPEAVRAIKSNTYVDDWLHSADTEKEMVELAKQVRWIHGEGGFEMRNWASTSKLVLETMTNSNVQDDKTIEEFDTFGERVLGLWWQPTRDVFSFSNNLSKSVFDPSDTLTKRQILRTVMTIFDPLGLLGFYVIRAKVILQNIWRSGVDWDDPVNENDHDDWLQWLRQIPIMRSIRIPRCFPLVSGGDNIELHTFVDASLDAYAAVCYIRAQKEGDICCSLIASKTRVTPLKPVSVPRLELMASVLGLRLAKFVETQLSVPLNRRYFWTDSKNVLYWIRSDARKYHQFVGLRIGEILEDSKVTEWRWVPTTLNVADDGTRWKTNASIDTSSSWFNGPDFLYANKEEWPTMHLESHEVGEVALESEVICHIGMNATTMGCLATITPDPTRFSKWERLRGAQMYVIRFLRSVIRSSPTPRKLVAFFNLNDFDAAECAIIRTCQESAFAEEFSLLSSSNKVGRKSQILKFIPYVDECGLLRSRGRVDALTDAPLDLKRPIILPKKYHITWLLIDFYHRRFHHHHNEIVINEIRQKFIVIGLRALVREVSKGCQACKKRRAAPVPPTMGDLPSERLAPFTSPFTYTGVDYFGPFDVAVGRRKEKRWGVIFSCLTTRAVHREIAPSLSTESFLLVLKQFINRRGVPRRIVSDNGTNFRGASRLLKAEIERVSSREVEERHPQIQWRFIPPAAPHMGGAWERMIRSVKSILMEILPTNGLREEVLRAALADAENTLNSRPLTYVPLDSPISEALTPNHFLIGSSSGIRERTSEDDSGPALGKNFALSNQLANLFWKRWVREYLPCLTRRAKWFQPPPDPVALGDVVIIVDENGKRNTWKKGVIMDLHYGSNGEARSAVVQTTSGLMTRPVVKLAKLDVVK